MSIIFLQKAQFILLISEITSDVPDPGSGSGRIRPDIDFKKISGSGSGRIWTCLIRKIIRFFFTKTKR